MTAHIQRNTEVQLLYVAVRTRVVVFLFCFVFIEFSHKLMSKIQPVRGQKVGKHGKIQPVRGQKVGKHGKHHSEGKNVRRTLDTKRKRKWYQKILGKSDISKQTKKETCGYRGACISKDD